MNKIETAACMYLHLYFRAPRQLPVLEKQEQAHTTYLSTCLYLYLYFRMHVFVFLLLHVRASTLPRLCAHACVRACV